MKTSERNAYHRSHNMQEKEGKNYYSLIQNQSSQKNILSFRKLKRDSAPYESDISETDKLLIQKDEEVNKMYVPENVTLFLILDTTYARNAETNARKTQSRRSRYK